MNITRQILSKTRWQTSDNRTLYITDMDDKHLRNAIRMLEKQGQTGSYSHRCLCTERTYRKSDKARTKEESKGQLTLDIDTTIKSDTPVIHPNFDTGNLFRWLDHICMKHHDFSNPLDDYDEYGY